ncbi:MAG: substrate-binding domain-containing protein, partial [Synergistaceae bacterium]|nr:substrate-binding domain-containing protein [Synergistaceae bacterium]
MRKALVAIVVLCLAAGMFLGSAAQRADAYTFGYTCMQLSNPFFTILEQTIRKQVEANGDVLITTDPAMDPVKQINQIEDLISQKIDAIFLNPVDWEAIRPA